MSETVFVDTNVFLYRVDRTDAVRQRTAALWLERLFLSGRGRVSFQVLQEYFVNVLRKKPTALDMVRAEIRDLLAWKPVVIDDGVLERAWVIQDRYHISFWDALIAAAAKAASCRWLLTEDLQHNQELDGLTIVNPFQRTPQDIGL